MADQYAVGNITVMEINPHITESSRRAVRGEQIQEETVLEVPGYPGMFVAKSGNMAIQTLSVFIEEEVRYVVGPKRV